MFTIRARMPMSSISQDPQALLESLRARARLLRAEVSGKLGEAAADAQGARGGGVDSGEQSVASAGSSLDLAEASRDLRELDAIDRAMTAIEQGRYGLCEQCGDDIGTARLVAQPLALRCIACQSLDEHRHPTPAPRL
jgi:DnaK suppressor protein